MNNFLCDLDEKCWDTPCTKENCDAFIKRKKYSNCFLLFKYFVSEESLNVDQIASVIGISTSEVLEIEKTAIEKVKNSLEFISNLKK